MKRGLIRFAESGLIPDEVIRRGIGLLNRKRLRLEEAGSAFKRGLLDGCPAAPTGLEAKRLLCRPAPTQKITPRVKIQ